MTSFTRRDVLESGWVLEGPDGAGSPIRLAVWLGSDRRLVALRRPSGPGRGSRSFRRIGAGGRAVRTFRVLDGQRGENRPRVRVLLASPAARIGHNDACLGAMDTDAFERRDSREVVVQETDKLLQVRW